VRVWLVHGFTQTGASWGPVARRLEALGHEVVTPDVAGHGRASAARVDLWGAAQLLAREADEAGGTADAAWVGYSMGGRVVLHLALAHPGLVQRLVLVSATAGIRDADERNRRRHDDDVLAGGLERDGVEAFVERWLDGPLFASLPREQAGIEHRLTNTPEGLASSLRLAGTGAQEPLWGRLSDVRAPALVLCGAEDAKFAGLGRELAAGLPHASFVAIPHAGHAVPWERTDAFVDAVDGWLRQ
jgi:2-succinyl-6-hydroxy-2,4-cyclohexadiene-1-carboxylate synthase